MTPVLWAAAAVATGTALGHGRSSFAVPLSLLTAVSLVLALRARRRAVWIVLVSIGCASGASAAWRTGASQDAVLPALAEEGSVEACGLVRALRPRSVEMRADLIEHRGTAWRTSEPLRVSGNEVTEARPGERLCARGEVVRPRAGRDEAPLLVARAVGERRPSSRVRLAASAVRARFSRAAQDVLPRTQAGLLLGMTDGDVRLLDEETVEAFRTTGLAHLVAVSGSNVAVLLVVVMLVARRVVRGRRWVHLSIAAPCLVFFAFLTGLEASVLRAVVSASVALFVAVEGRTSDGVRVASAAFVLLVGASPDLLFHPGFQLSFAATAGLIVWARPATEVIGRRLPASPLGEAVAACVGTTLAAQAAAAPFLAWHFGRIPALGGIANLLVAPLAPVVMVGGIVTLSAASLVDALSWAPLLLRFPLDAILWCGRTFARVPSASLEADVIAGVVVTGIVAACLARSRRTRAGALAAVVVAAAAGLGGAVGAPRCDGVSVVALDVGQGTAVLLRDGDDAVLVDGGPESGDVLDDLADQNVGRLDAIFVSHPHADHTEGVVEVLGALDVAAVYAPSTIGWGRGGDVVRAAARAGVPLRRVAAPDVLAFGAVSVEVLSPTTTDEPLRSEDNINAYSLVLRATVGGAAVLLPGDVGADDVRHLVDDPAVDAPVLVAPHHGSKDLDPAFVGSVSPEIVLVTVGEDNRYGHPAPEAMRTYASRARVFRSDRDGTVTLCMDAGEVHVTTEGREVA